MVAGAEEDCVGAMGGFDAALLRFSAEEDSETVADVDGIAEAGISSALGCSRGTGGNKEGGNMFGEGGDADELEFGTREGEAEVAEDKEGDAGWACEGACLGAAVDEGVG